MGRTLKRVPMDFAWPLKATWGGYLNPFSRQSIQCPKCDGSGYSSQAKLFSDQWYGKAPFDPVAYGATPLTVDHPAIQAFARGQCERDPAYYGTGQRAVEREAKRLLAIYAGTWSHHLVQADVDALVAADRLYDFTRVPRTDEHRAIVEKKVADGGNSWLPHSNGYTPTADEVNAWSIGGFGHDSINQWVCVEARCKREGVEKTCPMCTGEGDMWPSEKIRRQAERWKPTEPPRGEGYQLWETTSEGSPISPVFATLDELCEYAATHCSTFGSNRVSADRWREMLDKDFVYHVEGRNVFL